MVTNRSLGKREPQKDIQGSDFGEVIFFDFERNSFLHFSGSIRLFDNSQRPQSTPQHQRTTTSIDTSDNSAGSLVSILYIHLVLFIVFVHCCKVRYYLYRINQIKAIFFSSFLLKDLIFCINSVIIIFSIIFNLVKS